MPEPAHRASTFLSYPHSSVAHASIQKEPKLDRARQIPEWEVYDNEIAEFARRLEQQAAPAAATEEKPSVSVPEGASEGGEDGVHARDEL